jgi:hypothetical protein
MNATIATVVVAVIVPLTAVIPAHADTPEQAAMKELCRMLDGGESPDAVVAWMQRNYGGTVDGDRLAVGSAMHAYCPQDLPIPSNWDWTGH